MDANAKLQTNIQVKPARSQVVLVSLIVLAGICYVSGFLFLWVSNPNFWIPIIIGSFITITVVIAWFKAQKDTDLENSTPTTFTDDIGNQITTDTRALMSPEVIQNMSHLFSTLSHREPLPQPDGLIDEQGHPIPGTSEKAQQIVDDVNTQAHEITSIASSEFGFSQVSQPVVQPLPDELDTKGIMSKNI